MGTEVKTYNCMVDIFWFFNTPEQSLVVPNEFLEFWMSLSNEEKDYYRTAQL